MKLSRYIVWLTSAMLLGVMLSAQAAFATRPCLESGMSAASAITQQSEHDCCDSTIASEASLCLAQCTDSDKVTGQADVPVPQPSIVEAPAAIFPPIVLSPPRVWLASSGRDPPKTIRLCTLLI